MKLIQPYNPGIVLDRLPIDVFNILKEQVLEKRNQSDTFRNFRKSRLQVLSIKEIDDTPYFPQIANYINQSFVKWCELFNVSCEKFEIQSVWTNYMRANEFAPMHKHNPAIASFVIWIKIPYEIKNEKQFHYEGKDLDNTSKNGAFEFMYSTYTGTLEVHRIELDKNFEGAMLMFPGDLMHCVYPFFSSDQERISVAGNFYCLDSLGKVKV